MPVFIHVTTHTNLAGIKRVGIRAARGAGVCALPVTLNFQTTHQWVRELRRFGGGTMFGIYFRLPPDEIVAVGHYSGLHQTMSAAEAVKLMLETEKRDPNAARVQDAARTLSERRRRLPDAPEGYEVIVNRAIARSEIIRIKALPRNTGWRYRPGANGTPPSACLWAERGTWGLRRLEKSVIDAESKGTQSRISLFSRDASEARRAGRLRK